MAKGVRCIKCGYLFGFSNQGVDLANAEYDPEVLRQMKAGQLNQIDPKDQITFRNYTLEDWGFPPGGTTIGPHIWNHCSYIGCYRHQFPNVEVVRWDEAKGRVFDTSGLAAATHIERDCDFFFQYREGLSARQHEELERQIVFEQERAQVQWTEQLRQVFARFLHRVRQAQTNDEKKKSLEYLAEFLFETIKGLKVVDRDLRTSAEEIDRLVRNESDEPFWRNLGNPFLVECKNWGVPVGAKEIRDLKGKMDSRGIKTGFLLAKSGVSGNDYRDARLAIREALTNGRYIVVLDDSDLQEIADGTPPSEKLRDKYEDLFRI
jgi:hypothetical protein